LHSPMTVEMDALKKLANALGITTAELMEAEPTPTTLAYTRYILGVAYSGSFGEYVACILPCMWSYQVIGEKLRESDRLRSHPTYSRWASTYHSTEYRELVDLLKGQLDRLADTSGEAERSRMRGHFLTCSRYEFMFWDMAYKLEEWPV
ncbi:MAG: thiaminase II, partial [Candidatus Bathyarchaeia archaeon]